MSWYRRFVNSMRTGRLARDIDREMSFHLRELVEELVAAGWNEEEALLEARRRFGNRRSLLERVRDVDALGWIGSLASDLVFATRALRANPGFTLVAVLSLGLGIGANTSIFSLIDAVMLRPVPVRHPETLVQVTMADGNATFTNPLWEEIRDQAGGLDGSLAFVDQPFNLSTGGVVRRAAGAWVSGDYFSLLGVPPALGRVLQPADDVRGCPAVAVLSHGFWEREYGGAAGVVGDTLSLDSHPFEIVGVAAPGFSGIHVGRSAGIFVPLCTADILRPGRGLLDARSTWFLNVFGRLPADVPLEEARARIGASAPAVFAAAVPTDWSSEEQAGFQQSGLSLLPATTGLSLVRGQYSEALLTLLLLVGVVLLIACANVAQLLLARATARRHEIAVRLALGCSRMRLIRQLLTESVYLALLGAAVGTIFATWSSRFLVGLLSDNGQAVSLDLSLDLRVLAFTVATAIATGILFGLVPAWRAIRVDPQAALHQSGRALVGDSRQRVTRGIVVGQMALSLVLVMTAGLLLESFRRLTDVEPGFRPDGVLVVEANWSTLGFSDEQSETVPRELLDRLREIPGVREASASLLVPISGTSWNDFIDVDGFHAEDPRDALVWFNGVTDGYLQTLGTRLLAGRDFSPQDRAGSAPVILVNRTLARRFFGEAEPLGKQIRTKVHDGLGPPMEIVGVVEDGKYRRLDEETLPTAYVPLEQTEPWGKSIELTLRTDGPPLALVPVVTAAIRQVHPAITLEVTTLRDQVATSLARPRLLAILAGFFGAVALLLAVVGLYGTMSYSVTRRRSEMGIRIALGAARAAILRMIAGEAVRVVAIGLALGALLALAATRLMTGLLFGVTPADPWTLVLSATVLAAVAMAACLVPAWRAARVDPLATLREE